MSFKTKKSNGFESACLMVGAVILATFGPGSSDEARAVTWERQAERLQLVSASLLDAQPLLSPAGDSTRNPRFRVEGKAIASVLPKINATVGGKTEQPPQPPAHTVPTIEAGLLMPRSSWGGGVARAWAGMLPASAAKGTGMTALCAQNIQGLSLGVKNDVLPLAKFAAEVGQQWSSTKVEGGITEPEAKDLFEVKARLRFATLTVHPRMAQSAWVQVQVSERNVTTHFEIPADGTSFDLTDHSTLAGGTAATQVSLGYEFTPGFNAAVAYLNVPERVSMPRFLISYSTVSGRSDRELARND